MQRADGMPEDKYPKNDPRLLDRGLFLFNSVLRQQHGIAKDTDLVLLIVNMSTNHARVIVSAKVVALL